jgi:hypothetical protein
VRQGPLSNVLGMLSAIKKLIIMAFKARILTKLALPKVVLLWLSYRMLKAFLGRKRKRKSDSQ